ncbi:MAG TPA: biotin/lipoyl-binding protein, partial [Polyangiaceae bacterium]|nr:biotin/lipoyl-binding protein [Polyangiaceae bacterium]
MSTARVPSSPVQPAAPAQPPVAAVPADAAPASGVPPARRRRPLVIVAAVGALVALGVGGYAVATAGHETTDDAFIEADIVSVQAEVGGRVLEVLAHTDQHVTAGDVLLRLD